MKISKTVRTTYSPEELLGILIIHLDLDPDAKIDFKIASVYQGPNDTMPASKVTAIRITEENQEEEIL